MPLNEFVLDHIEIYAPMARLLAYWHSEALGFTVTDIQDIDTGRPGLSSYVLRSGDICLVLSGAYPIGLPVDNREVSSFIEQNYYGVKKIALRVSSVEQAFNASISNGGVPIKPPFVTKDESGYIEEAEIKLYDNSVIAFINRDHYKGGFKPGYRSQATAPAVRPILKRVDHVASELRMNETRYWTRYLSDAVGIPLIQRIDGSEENISGMILNICQPSNKAITLVLAEPQSCTAASKIQKNLGLYGPGIHHLAFATESLFETTEILRSRKVEFVRFPDSYYHLLRENPEFSGLDIDSLQHKGIIVDKKADSLLLQKFIKPIGDRPFFLYEIVERVNGYNGFAVNNINILKKSEEMELQK